MKNKKKIPINHKKNMHSMPSNEILMKIPEFLKNYKQKIKEKTDY